MALGQIICQYKLKIVAIKTEPFPTGGEGVRQEIYGFSELSGRVSGNETGTYYGTTRPDGSGTGTYYGVLTTNEGETVLIEGRAVSMITSPTQVKFRAAVSLKTASSRLAWLNSTPAAFEGIGDMATQEVNGTIYEWT